MVYQVLIGPAVVALISATLEEETAIMIMNAQETLFVDPTIVWRTIQLLEAIGHPLLIVVTVSNLTSLVILRSVCRMATEIL